MSKCFAFCCATSRTCLRCGACCNVPIMFAIDVNFAVKCGVITVFTVISYIFVERTAINDNARLAVGVLSNEYRRGIAVCSNASVNNDSTVIDYNVAIVCICIVFASINTDTRFDLTAVHGEISVPCDNTEIICAVAGNANSTAVHGEACALHDIYAIALGNNLTASNAIIQSEVNACGNVDCHPVALAAVLRSESVAVQIKSAVCADGETNSVKVNAFEKHNGLAVCSVDSLLQRCVEYAVNRSDRAGQLRNFLFNAAQLSVTYGAVNHFVV